MAKLKVPPAQESQKADEKVVYLPPGLINHGNTCFMNSVVQGVSSRPHTKEIGFWFTHNTFTLFLLQLIATPLLSDLALFALTPQSLSLTNVPSISSRRSPQLTNGHGLAGEFEQKWVAGMPIGDVFVYLMHKAWSIQNNRQRENLSPRRVHESLFIPSVIWSHNTPFFTESC